MFIILGGYLALYLDNSQRVGPFSQKALTNTSRITLHIEPYRSFFEKH